jgi:hypothetical protein
MIRFAWLSAVDRNHCLTFTFQVKALDSKKSKSSYKTPQEIDNQITYVRL